MKGDFTRNTFYRTKHYSSVLVQQGRVTVDADYNEQSAILLSYLRTLAADLIGPYAAPSTDAGFTLRYDTQTKDVIIGQGRYYVDGIMVENEADTPYSQQLDWPLPDNDALAAAIKSQTIGNFWLYLDVWERHITYLDDSVIREKALGGPDTCTRSKVVWQVKALTTTTATSNPTPADCAAPLTQLVAVSNGLLGARVDPGLQVTDACTTSPDAKYRGTENHLYRVEVHDAGTAGSGATIKWSRDNGSVVTAWLSTAGQDLVVSNTRGFAAGNWVELLDDTDELQGRPGVFVKLVKVQGNALTIDSGSSTSLPDVTKLPHPKVRRWDQTGNEDTQLVSGVIPIAETADLTKTANWIDLEDGIQIAFSNGATYRTGDYWLIAARVATGQIEWPGQLDSTGRPVLDQDGNQVPALLPPDGIEHHYAPLGFLQVSTDGVQQPASCQCTFDPGSKCFQAAALANGARPVRPKNFDARPIAVARLEEAQAAATIQKRKKK